MTGAMHVLLALCLVTATLSYGAVTVRLAGPVYGLAVLLGLLWSALLFTSSTITWQQSPTHLPVACFVGYAFIRYFTSPIEYESRLDLIHVCLYALVYFLASSNFYRPRDRAILLVTLIALAFVESTYGVWQFATKAKTVLFETRPVQYQFRGGGTFFCPNHLAGFLELVLGLLVARFAIYRSVKDSVQKTVIQKVVLIYMALLVMAGIITSLSRAGWIAATLGLLSLLVWGEWRVRTLMLRVVVVVLTIGLFGLIAFNVNPVRDYVALTFAGLDESKPIQLDDAGLGGRKHMWGATVKMIRDYPLWGTGPGTWQWFHLKYRDPRMVMHPEYAHSDVLNLASDYGLVGFALVVAIFACFFWHVVLLARRSNDSEQRSFAIGSAMGVTALLVHSWFDFNMHIPANALLLVTIMGFTVAMEDGHSRFKRVEMKPPLKYALATLLFLFFLAGGWLGGRTFLADRDTYKGNNARLSFSYDHALGHYQRAIEVDPKFAKPYAKMGDIYRTQSYFQIRPEWLAKRKKLAQQAIAAYQRSLTLNPYNSDVLVRLARSYELAGDDDAAFKTYQQALAIDPNNAFNHFRVGMFYRNSGDEKRAAEHFEKSRQLNWWSDQGSALNVEELRPKP